MSDGGIGPGGSWGIATPHVAATEAATTVLAEGGTAVDAAICAAGVLTVVYPHNCSLGGDLISLVRNGDQPPKAVYGVGRAAARLDAESVRSVHGTEMPAVGPLSITVPGVVSGWVAMHQLGGSMPFTRLLEPAAALAAGGVRVSPSVARALQALASDDPGISEVFGPAGARLREGDLLVQSRLAETIAHVAEDPDGFYRGDLAGRLAEGLTASGSALRAEDLHGHRAGVADALARACGRLAPMLFTADLPSQGAYLGDLVRVLHELLEAGHDLAGEDGHLLARTFAAFSQLRDELLCDPARSSGRRVAEERFRELLRAAAVAPPPGRSAAAARGAVPCAQRPEVLPSGDTVAVVVRDGAGRAVSMLQSIFFSFGAKVLDPGTGVLFHNRGGMFSLVPGAPAELAPGLCPPHTLCPIMVDAPPGQPSLLLSTMGGRGQPQILASILLGLAAGRELSDAVAAPRVIVGDSARRGSWRMATLEKDAPGPLLGALRADGFDVRTVERHSEATGHAQALLVGPDGTVRAASDPRSDGSAACGP